MPRNGSGVYSLPAGNPVVTGTIISSTWANTTLNDIAAALTQSLAKDGQTPITGNWNLNNFQIINLGDGDSRDDAANLGQVQDDVTHWCGTAGGTANALTMGPDIPVTAYAAGQYFTFIASLNNTSATTVSIGGLAAKQIRSGGTVLIADDIVAGRTYRITYDGTRFQLEECSVEAGGGAATVVQVQNNSLTWCGTAGGTADALTLTPSPDISAYAAGQAFAFQAGASPNTGAATVAVSGLSAKQIRNGGDVLDAADIEANLWYRITYDGTRFQLEKLALGAATNEAAALSGGSDVGFRLSLESGVPIPDTDQLAKTQVRCVPFNSTYMGLFINGNWKLVPSAQISVAVPSTTETPFDVFANDENDTGTITLETVDWTDDSTRDVDLVTQDGRYVMDGDPTRRYLGTGRTTGVSGQCEDSNVKRFLWNYYNRVNRSLYVTEPTATWTYGTATIRQANANADNQVEFVTGIREEPVTALLLSVSGGTSTTVVVAGHYIGLDSTTAAAAGSQYGNSPGTGTWSSTGIANYGALPSIGWHRLTWLESGNTASGSQTTFIGADITGIRGIVKG